MTPPLKRNRATSMCTLLRIHPAYDQAVVCIRKYLQNCVPKYGITYFVCDTVYHNITMHAIELFLGNIFYLYAFQKSDSEFHLIVQIQW